MIRARFIGAAIALVLPLLLTVPAGAAKEGEMCAGFAGIKCDDGLFCEKPAGKCGVADLDGKCEKQPEVCTKEFKPVCACGGKQYGNDCERKAAGAQKDYDGPCEKTADYVCGGACRTQPLGPSRSCGWKRVL